MKAFLHDPRYTEPILLALGLIGREQPEELERVFDDLDVCDVGNLEAPEVLLGRNFLFSLRVLADDVPLGSEVIDKLLERVVEHYLDDLGLMRYSRFRAELEARVTALSKTTRAAGRLQAILAITARDLEGARACELMDLMLLLQSAGLTQEVLDVLDTYLESSDAVVRCRAAALLVSTVTWRDRALVELVSLITEPQGDTAARALRALIRVEELPEHVWAAILQYLQFKLDDSQANQVQPIISTLLAIVRDDSPTEEKVNFVLRLIEEGNLPPALQRRGLFSDSFRQALSDPLNQSVGPGILQGRKGPADAVLFLQVAQPHVLELIMEDARHAGNALEQERLAALLLDAGYQNETAADALHDLLSTGTQEDLPRIARTLLKVDRINPRDIVDLLESQGAVSSVDQLLLAVSAMERELTQDSPSNEVILALLRLVAGTEPSMQFGWLGREVEQLLAAAVRQDDIKDGLTALAYSRIEQPLARLRAARALRLAGFSLDDALSDIGKVDALEVAVSALILLPSQTLTGSNWKRVWAYAELGDGDFQLRSEAISFVASLPTSPEVEGRLLQLLKDSDNDVRSAAAATLVQLSRQSAIALQRIRSALIEVASEQSLELRDVFENRCPWDYAHDALWSLVELEDR